MKMTIITIFHFNTQTFSECCDRNWINSIVKYWDHRNFDAIAFYVIYICEKQIVLSKTTKCCSKLHKCGAMLKKQNFVVSVHVQLICFRNYLLSEEIFHQNFSLDNSFDIDSGKRCKIKINYRCFKSEHF